MFIFSASSLVMVTDIRSDVLAALVYDSALISRLHEMVNRVLRTIVHGRGNGFAYNRISSVILYYALCRLLHPSARTVGEELSPNVFIRSTKSKFIRMRLFVASIAFPLFSDVLVSHLRERFPKLGSISELISSFIGDVYLLLNPHATASSLIEDYLTPVKPNTSAESQIVIPKYLLSLCGVISLTRALGKAYTVLGSVKQPTALTELISDCNDDHRPSSGTCPVCMCEIDHPTATVCGHVFCWECCVSWTSIDGSPCPVCRTVSYPQDLLPLSAYAPTSAEWKPFWTRPFILDS